MRAKSDITLLARYAENQAESAFAELVRRHTDLVYSTALRQVNSPDTAGDVTQEVFLALATSARLLSRKMNPDSSLAGWLYRTSRNISLNFKRNEFRRRSRELKAMVDYSASSEAISPDWERLQPILDEAMSELKPSDSDALVLRYFKKHDLQTVGIALGVTENTAQKRISRALEKLRRQLSRRTIPISTAALALALATNAIQAAPTGLVIPVSFLPACQPAIHGITAITMTTLQKALTVAAISATGFGIFKAHQASVLEDQVHALYGEKGQLSAQVQDLRRDLDQATNKFFLASPEASFSTNEVLRLRGEIARIRASLHDVTPAEQAIRRLTERVANLKVRLEAMPEMKIPELKLLNDQDWADAVWDADLETDDGVREALSKLRDRAVNAFFNVLRPAMSRYIKANNDSLPVNLSEVREFIQPPIDDSVFPRYALRQTGQISADPGKTLVELIAHVDEDYDSNHDMTINGASGGRYNRVEGLIEEAAKAFADNHNGQNARTPEEVTPYLSKSIEEATVRKYLAKITSSH